MIRRVSYRDEDDLIFRKCEQVLYSTLVVAYLIIVIYLFKSQSQDVCYLMKNFSNFLNIACIVAITLRVTLLIFIFIGVFNRKIMLAGQLFESKLRETEFVTLFSFLFIMILLFIIEDYCLEYQEIITYTTLLAYGLLKSICARENLGNIFENDYF